MCLFFFPIFSQTDVRFIQREKISWEGEFTFRSDSWAGLIASWGSFYPMTQLSLRYLLFFGFSFSIFLGLVSVGRKRILCAWRLHPNTRNQAKGMLEVLRLAVCSEFDSRVSVRPSKLWTPNREYLTFIYFFLSFLFVFLCLFLFYGLLFWKMKYMELK